MPAWKNIFKSTTCMTVDMGHRENNGKPSANQRFLSPESDNISPKKQKSLLNQPFKAVA
jgi:hypothetical protein